MTDTARKLLYLLGKGTGGRWVLVIALAVVVGLLEVAGGVMVFVMLGLVTNADLTVPLLGDLRTLAPGLDERQLLLGAAGMIGAFFVVRAGVLVAQDYLEHRVAENAGARLSDRIARGYLAMPYAFHLRRNSAELIRNAIDSVQEIIDRVFLRGVRMLAELFIVVGLLVVLVVTAPVATALVVAVLLPLNYGLLRLVQPRFRRLGARRQAHVKESFQSLQEALHGLRDVKLLGREDFFADVFARSRANLARVRYLRGALARVPYVATETGLVLAILAFFAYAVVRGRASVDALPVLGLFAYAGFRMKPSLTAIVASLNSIRYAGPAIDDLHADVVLCERALDERPRTEPAPLPFEQEIRVERVSFRYPGADVDALREVDLTVPQGATVGIVGPTGGGKTTLVDLLVGLLHPTRGTIQVDGMDLQDRTRAWQAVVGVVPQTLFLVDDSLRRNIALGEPDREIDAVALADAVRLAQLEEVVASMPQGLDTVVGERGVRLSGGQRQRVAIARALYRRPAVLVFDEGTAALDNATEKRLIDGLHTLRGRHTLLIVAHRLSTVQDCDFVVLVADGRVADVGTFPELVHRNADFQELTR